MKSSPALVQPSFRSHIRPPPKIALEGTMKVRTKMKKGLKESLFAGDCLSMGRQSVVCQMLVWGLSTRPVAMAQNGIAFSKRDNVPCCRVCRRKGMGLVGSVKVGVEAVIGVLMWSPKCIPVGEGRPQGKAARWEGVSVRRRWLARGNSTNGCTTGRCFGLVMLALEENRANEHE